MCHMCHTLALPDNHLGTVRYMEIVPSTYITAASDNTKYFHTHCALIFYMMETGRW